MFRIHFTNVVTAAEGETFPTLSAAVKRGIELHFEFSVWQGDTIAASWTVFGGLVTYPIPEETR